MHTKRGDLMTFQKNTQNRINSKVAWGAVSALLFFLLNNWGLLPKIGLEQESFKQLSDLALTAFISLGIFNNPTDPEHL